VKREKFDFNFWPSFTDIMLSLILVLFLFFAFFVYASSDSWMLKKIKTSEMDIINSVGTSYKKAPAQNGEGVFTIKLGTAAGDEIIFVNEPTLQRIRFSTNVLFDRDDYRLKDRGKDILSIIGAKIMEHQSKLREIQIQGHADPDLSKKFAKYGNLELGAFRAMSVYLFLKENVHIDPCKSLMSATSFGEFKPIQRKEGQRLTVEELDAMNGDEDLKAMNRRIELVLFYDLPNQGRKMQ
jgi:flagellar motor protein MotB